MSKRRLSDSPSSCDRGSSSEAGAQNVDDAHVSKFYRTSTSPPPSDSSDSDMESATALKDCNTGIKARAIQCLLPPHAPTTFSSVAEFEAHLYSYHTFRCISCHANFPTSHLLDLHQEESHDPLIAARREKGEKTFRCLVPGCEKACADRFKRRRHVVDKHGYRKDYDWAMVERGIDGRGSALKVKDGGENRQRGRKMSLTGGLGERGVKRSVGFQRDRPLLDAKKVVDVAEGHEDEEQSVVEIDGEDQRDQAALKLKDSMTPEKSHGKADRRGPANEDPVGDITSGISALRFVPSSVRRRQDMSKNNK